MGQYRDIEKRRAYMRAYQKKKYSEDATHREKAKAVARDRMREKYQSDPEHRAKVLAASKQRQTVKAEEIRAYQRTYKQENRDKLAEAARIRKAERYANDAEYREKCKQQARDAYATPEGKQYARTYSRRKKDNDPSYRMISNVRGRIRGLLQGTDRSVSTMELIGCSADELRAHLEKQFQPGMSWDNYAYYGWHVDHKIPCANFDLTSPEQQRKCFHFSNLQPMFRAENQSKGNREAPRGIGSKPFPIRTPTDADADRDHERLQRLPSVNLWMHGVWSTKSTVPETVPFYINVDRTGLRASDRFHWNVRMGCSSNSSPSPAESWFNPRHREAIERSSLFRIHPQVALSMTKYVPNQFRPSAAKALYELFGATKIYDPCGGWGDRMAAALATDSVERYHCRDVNPLVLPGYAAQKQRFDKTDKVTVEMVPAEECAPNGEFDFVFTSPPYFKTEKYHGAMQSHLSHPDFHAWMTDFLFKTFENAWTVLVPGGHMVVNIADCLNQRTPYKICEPFIAWARATLSGCVFHGVAGYRIGKRITKIQTEGAFCEPLIIFSKGPSNWMDRLPKPAVVAAPEIEIE